MFGRLAIAWMSDMDSEALPEPGIAKRKNWNHAVLEMS